MLLQRLVDRTQPGEAGEPEFFRDRPVRWQLALTADGDLASAQLTDLAEPSDQTRKNGTVYPVPHTTRTVGVAPCIGADDIQYVLGWCDDKSKPARVKQCHASFISITNAWMDRTRTKPRHAPWPASTPAVRSQTLPRLTRGRPSSSC
jgi:CRISPR-associated protein Csd1